MRDSAHCIKSDILDILNFALNAGINIIKNDIKNITFLILTPYRQKSVRVSKKHDMNPGNNGLVDTLSGVGG